jgi:hypothetical protein
MPPQIPNKEAYQRMNFLLQVRCRDSSVALGFDRCCDL